MTVVVVDVVGVAMIVLVVLILVPVEQMTGVEAVGIKERRRRERN